jgi:uncharacterized cupredoxin-like copper-binding protein
MRRVLLGLACGAAAATAAATAAVAAVVAVAVAKHRMPHSPAHVLVYAQEWHLYPSRGSLPAGKVDVELWNRGQDAHDLRIRRLHGGRMVGRVRGAVKITQSGKIATASWRLAAGRYELYCSMPGHLARGMHSTIVVR